ncbi:MAG: HAMP domain-containing protein [bacterium]|nr:HAMP domain-containing protein [bacterium]
MFKFLKRKASIRRNVLTFFLVLTIVLVIGSAGGFLFKVRNIKIDKTVKLVDETIALINRLTRRSLEYVIQSGARDIKEDILKDRARITQLIQALSKGDRELEVSALEGKEGVQLTGIAAQFDELNAKIETLMQMDQAEITVEDGDILILLDELISTNKEIAPHINQLAAGLEISAARSNTITLGIFFSATLIAVILSILAILSTRRIGKRYGALSRVFLKLRDVDFTEKIDVKSDDELGEIGESINLVIDNLKNLVQKVMQSTQGINQATDEISLSSEDLASRTNEQAASITETSTTLEDFSSIMKQNSGDSNESSAALETFNREIQTRKKLIENLTATMTAIDDSSKKIDNIVHVINDISFQTNLLALNAAVEAARAGEAGRGFAVVASEVRSLAQKTAESSKTIQEIVGQNVDATHKGMALAAETSEFFSSIMKMLRDISTRINRIASGSREQATGVDQINQAISQLETVINQNAALVEEFAATGKSLKANANQLDELVGRFKI